MIDRLENTQVQSQIFFERDSSVWLQHDRSGEYKPRSSVPRHEIEAIVHTFYPAIAAFFESEEGKREYEEWKAKREERKEKKTPAEQSA